MDVRLLVSDLISLVNELADINHALDTAEWFMSDDDKTELLERKSVVEKTIASKRQSTERLAAIGAAVEKMHIGDSLVCATSQDHDRVFLYRNGMMTKWRESTNPAEALGIGGDAATETTSAVSAPGQNQPRVESD